MQTKFEEYLDDKTILFTYNNVNIAQNPSYEDGHHTSNKFFCDFEFDYTVTYKGEPITYDLSIEQIKEFTSIHKDYMVDDYILENDLEVDLSLSYADIDYYDIINDRDSCDYIIDGDIIKVDF